MIYTFSNVTNLFNVNYHAEKFIIYHFHNLMAVTQLTRYVVAQNTKSY